MVILWRENRRYMEQYRYIRRKEEKKLRKGSLRIEVDMEEEKSRWVVIKKVMWKR